jgi:DMSO/TMAO reductase YedYZ molybdopterin-dependent catalytic subunit
MGGTEGDPNPANFRMRVHGLVKKPLELDYQGLLRLPQTEQTCDVHCVTTWSMLDSQWIGVQVAHLAELAGVQSDVRHVIFEANAGYTANVPLAEAIAPNVLVAHRHSGDPLGVPHGAPVRALVPDLYFWKSAKWLTGIRCPAEAAATEPRVRQAVGRSKARLQWRPLVRSFHRDAGYVAVGLTVVYALSGLAVNHVKDWDPNFRNYRAVHELRTPLPANDDVAARQVLDRLGIQGQPLSATRYAPDQLDIRLPNRVIVANPQTGRVVVEEQKSRFFLRVANWLHLNRGKKAWTLVADLYAVGLLLLALSGMFMLPGKNGLLGRGAVLILAGIAVPVLYVVLSGGPPPPSRAPSTSPGAQAAEAAR